MRIQKRIQLRIFAAASQCCVPLNGARQGTGLTVGYNCHGQGPKASTWGVGKLKCAPALLWPLKGHASA